MKIKKGRISLKKENLKRSFVFEITSQRKNSKNKENFLNIVSRLKIDPRPIFTKSFISSCVYEIKIFLIDNRFDINQAENFFLKPTRLDFFEIILFLIQKIDLNFQFSKKIEEDISFFLKIIKYPFLICKSSFYSIASPHTWAILVSCLKWITEIISYQIRLEKENIIEVVNIPLKHNIWGKIVRLYHRHLPKKNIQRILWAYCVIKLFERKLFKKYKIEKKIEKKKKISFYKNIWSLYLYSKIIFQKKLDSYKIFYFLCKSNVFQKNLVISWSNYILQISRILNLKIFWASLNIIKKNDYIKFYQLKIKNKSVKKLLNIKLKLNFDFFCEILKKFKRIELFSKMLFFSTFDFMILNYQIFSKKTLFLLNKFIKNFEFNKLQNFRIGIDFLNVIHGNLNSLKLFLKNRNDQMFMVRLLKDDVDNILFLLRRKKISLNLKKKKLLFKIIKVHRNRFFELKILIYQYTNFFVTYYILKIFLNNLFYILNLKKSYLFLFKIRSFFSLCLLISNLIYVFSLIS
jgi:hypothetical protein